jgi:hypothetical protein
VDGCGEILVHGTLQYRLIGYVMSSPSTFCILLICSHKDGVYKPPSAFETAISRKRAIERDNHGVVPSVRPR